MAKKAWSVLGDETASARRRGLLSYRIEWPVSLRVAKKIPCQGFANGGRQRSSVATREEVDRPGRTCAPGRWKGPLDEVTPLINTVGE